MIVFLILLFPLSSLWLFSGKNRPLNAGLLSEYARDYYLPGIVYFIPALFIEKILTGFLTRTYSTANIYLYHLLSDYLFFNILASASCLIRFRNLMYRGTDEKLIHHFLFLAGFFTALSFYTGVLVNEPGDFYTFFLLPLAWLLMAGFSSFFLVYMDMETGIMRFFHVSGFLAYPLAAALIPFFFYIRMPALSFLIILLMAASGYYLARFNAIEL